MKLYSKSWYGFTLIHFSFIKSEIQIGEHFTFCQHAKHNQQFTVLNESSFSNTIVNR